MARPRSLVPRPAPAVGSRSTSRWLDSPELDTSGLSYIVVDEIEGNLVGLAVSDWPRKDEHGRLRFDAEPRLVCVQRDALERFLDEHRPTSRPVRIGDVFAARARPTEGLVSPEDLLEPPVRDVTADAREAAKIAFYSAVTPIVEGALSDELVVPPDLTVDDLTVDDLSLEEPRDAGRDTDEPRGEERSIDG